jgi:conjugative transfer signal peptidase TraF
MSAGTPNLAATGPRRIFGRKRALTMREKRRVMFGITGAVAGAFAIVAGCHSAGLWINTTDSMPMGLWRQAADQAARPGDVVLLCLPANPATELGQVRGYIAPGPCPTGQEVLLKPIAAGAGDVVTISPAAVTVNGHVIANSAQLLEDSRGRPLPAYPAGTYRVPAGEIWLVSPHNRRSFDSRYFGPVPSSLVRSTVRPVWVFD